MSRLGIRVFAALLRAYPREFRERYDAELIAFFLADREHARHGSGPLRPARFWISTLRDLSRTALTERFPSLRRPALDKGTPMRALAALRFDLHNAVRSLRGAPAFTLTALLVLSLGIGVSTAIFSVVDGVVLRGLPFEDEHRLVAINETDLKTGRPVPAAYPNFADWVNRQDVFEVMGASASAVPLVTADAERPERLTPHRITPSLFDLLKVRPAIGVPFTSVDVRQNPNVALISDGLWHRRFGADPNVIGTKMAFRSGTFEIIGVMPSGFVYPIGSSIVSRIDLWIPLVPQTREMIRGGARNYSLRVFGRLRPEATLAEASTRMKQIRDALAAEHPQWFVDRDIVVRPMKDSIVPATVRSWMMMLLAAVAGVLFAACANTANLLLARATGRSREIGVRAAMGATRWQIVRGLLVESVTLAIAGTAGGLLLASWGVDLLRVTLPASLPRVATIAVDLRVILMAGLAAVATGCLCGLIPALRMSKVDISAALRNARGGTTDRAGQRLRTAFLVTEVALATALLVGAGVFMSSFVRLVRTEMGFNARGVLSVIVLTQATDREDAGTAMRRLSATIPRTIEPISSIAGVESVSVVAGGAPLSGSYSTLGVTVGGRTFADADEAVVKQATSGYLETIGATVLRGRPIVASDTASAQLVVVINDEAARRYFGRQDAIGAEITLENDVPRTIVGVVRGMRLLGPETAVQPEVYVPYAQSSQQSVSPQIVIRTSGDPNAMIPAVKNAIWSVMPDAVIPEASTFEQMFAALIAQRRLNMVLLALFGGLALFIAAIGIYGVFAYLVELRTKEIGVRIALGAVRSRILVLVLSQATKAIGLGLAVGFMAAAWLEYLVMTFVYRGIPHDPLVYGGTALLLLGLGAMAAYIPARRAASVDPVVALRAE